MKRISEKCGNKMVWGSIYAFTGVSHTTLSAASYSDTEPRMLRYFSSETMWLMAKNPKVTLPAYKMEWITATLIFNIRAASVDLHASMGNPHNPTSMQLQLLRGSKPC